MQENEGTEPERQDDPDEDAGPAVEPVEGDQGEQVPADAAGSTPGEPVRTSAPPPEAQSGVPQPTDGSNEGVEADESNRGPVESGQGVGQEGVHSEANTADTGNTDDDDDE